LLKTKGITMKFIMTFEWTPDAQKRAEGIERFRKTGGQPPHGAKLLGRWTRADLSGGFDLIETNDPQALAAFAYMWNDLMHLTIVPVLEDAALVEALERSAA
jgi:hypothetical protein